MKLSCSWLHQTWPCSRFNVWNWCQPNEKSWFLGVFVFDRVHWGDSTVPRVGGVFFRQTWDIELHKTTSEFCRNILMIPHSCFLFQESYPTVGDFTYRSQSLMTEVISVLTQVARFTLSPFFYHGLCYFKIHSKSKLCFIGSTYYFWAVDDLLSYKCFSSVMACFCRSMGESKCTRRGIFH